MGNVTDMSDQETNVEGKRERGSHGKVTLPLLLAIFGAAMGSFQFGYNTGVINAPEARIKEFMNYTVMKRSGSPIHLATQTNLFALLVATFAIGGAVGGLMAGWWADYFGRKNGSLLNAVIGVAAAALMFFSRMAWAHEMIIVGRLLVGFNCGLYTGLTPLYLSEIATTNLRGALGVLHQLFIVSGIFVSQILGFPEILGNWSFWDILLGLTVVPCFIQLLVMPWSPESPRYLLITKQRNGAAKKALKRLRATDDVDDDMKEMSLEAEKNEKEVKINVWQLFTMKSLRRPLIISVVMQLSQQLSGINAIFYYSANLFKEAGLEETVAVHATSGVGAIMIVMTIVTLPLMDRVGRRTLHLIGLGGMFVFSILITVCLTLKDVVWWFNMASIIVSLLYVVFFAIGPGSIPWLIVSELFSQGPRSAAIGISVLVNWVANFCVGYAFPHMQKGLQDYSFIPFTVLLAFFWIFTFLFLPETKNKTFDEISAIWRKHREPDTDRNKELYLVSSCNTDNK